MGYYKQFGEDRVRAFLISFFLRKLNKLPFFNSSTHSQKTNRAILINIDNKTPVNFIPIEVNKS